MRVPAFVALACLLLLAPIAAAATPAPGPSGSAAATPKALDITGHWTSASYGDIDFAQKGVDVTGTSPTGVNLSGVLTGHVLNFSFWRGKSYDVATAENRGHGKMTVAADGKSASVTWASEDPKGHYNGTFTLIKVGGGGGGKTASPEATVAEPTSAVISDLEQALLDISSSLTSLSSGDSADDMALVGIEFLIVWAANHPEAVASELPTVEPWVTPAPTLEAEWPFQSAPPDEFPGGSSPIDDFTVGPDDFAGGQ